ncbi:amino-acid N-acetyltransferase [Reinekea thalattae]|uniref:Amino-acid acetyltransferase n=1 Tax=Reinekea thalattae TaxID=2593301 RepID=A0A5C8Z446_9GAMM|nr:amino-acid N-acetyltransferase [Reinekea thalattae]TXR51968.1 amino-acid N-acetyltransferase [Reinekea thalattae]
MDFVSHFRNSAPYIHAYRGKTSVVWIRDHALTDERLEALVSDLALLNSLGLKLIVLFDVDCFDTELTPKDMIDPARLNQLTEAIGRRRYQLEALFSQGIANSPMHGSKMKIISGNFVMARPAGVFEGKDLQAQGRVRRVDANAIKEQLDKQHLVLIPPLGYSITGDILYLPPEQLVVELAMKTLADKVVIMGNDPMPISQGQKEMNAAQLEKLIAQQPANKLGSLELQVACEVSRAGIARCHVLNGSIDGSLLVELFTRDGVGMLIPRDQYDTFRRANLNDIQGIIALLKPLEEKQILVKRNPEKIEAEINSFVVNERDGMIIGCAAVHSLSKHQAELACVAVHPDYQKNGRGDALLNEVEKQAKQSGIRELYALTTQTEHWFVERGFKSVAVQQLPQDRIALYNVQRNSKVYLKTLS